LPCSWFLSISREYRIASRQAIYGVSTTLDAWQTELKKIHRSMNVPMVNIREMSMGMGNRQVSVRMSVRFVPIPLEVVRVLMVLVMAMAVIVIHQRVGM
jgi:hypothetical protein